MANSSASKLAKLAPTQEESDRISNLPDHLLHHTLSFLPIKQAVATSLILSKRWALLGLAMPILDIINSAFPLLVSFIQFVDAVVFLSDSKTINMFRLKCQKFIVPRFKINLWINAAINSKVQHLELCFANFNNDVDLPTRLFHNSTIMVLKLSRVFLNAQSTVNLPSLKVMHLEKVQFKSPESAANIFNGCSHLEEVVLKCEHLSGTSKIRRLEHLVSAELRPPHVRLTAFSNVRSLRFVEDWWVPHKNAIPTFYNLTHLELSWIITHDANHFVECLERFPKLEALVIHKEKEDGRRNA
ncbi:F-box/FBD/LRR-repeat protein At5g22700-like [Neltuma alba]|uniref:F-box/FBD/LRR-repeat protein At5g22700-like n=1 Tax=Neltuma alba TaxID=207710 RepID=UPI0010A3FFCE|nr:F-box/FBD/LRR-repeat protein At5g22700-like [Prosopis alba]